MDNACLDVNKKQWKLGDHLTADLLAISFIHTVYFSFVAIGWSHITYTK